MKVSDVVLFIFSCAACTAAAEQHPECDADYVDGFYYKKGLYKGKLCEGLPTGYGILTYHNGTVRKGSYIDGELNGEVITFFGEKAKVIGNFIKGKEHGRFVITYSDGSVYESFYDEGRVVEKARIPLPLISYIGERNDIGQRNGFGEGVYRSGDIYIGEWRENGANGYGIYLWLGGASFYLGEKVGGISHGYGVKFIDGHTKYVGDWVEGKEQGRGVKYYIGGDLPKEMVRCIYDGEFVRGIPKGNLDCSRKGDSEFWEKINNTKPDLSKLKEEYPDYNWDRLHGASLVSWEQTP